MLVDVKYLARLLAVPADHITRAVRAGYVRAQVENGKYMIDSTTIRFERKRRYSNPVMQARAGCDAWRGLVPVVARRGPKASARAYATLSEADRSLLDAWCKSRGIESPSHYI